ncbi:MAG: 1-deoxy-D-xylulose-5-phosphate synthase [Ruminococcaceae bacterium]|nr:1-deoxy-D-xylulose-5-phosphate synthase [Oscillospiraceae bacterium]
MEIRFLDKIKSPNDIKILSDVDLTVLAKEVRETLITTISKNGGHLSSNLGIVELTIALHKVFDSPSDQIIWDVGHQVYPHKLFTGRYDKFSTLRKKGGLSGFPNPEESNHDIFAAGHSGTSVSAAYGLSVAKTMKEDTKSFTIAVIGDGSITGGLVYEALNNAGRNNTNLIVILNDNEMSISPNVGSMARYLAAIRTNPIYYRAKEEIIELVEMLPNGKKIHDRVSEAKKLLKNYMYKSNFFEDLGFAYMGPINGHNIKSLCRALEGAKEFDKPVLLHIQTIKGKGYYHAEIDPAKFHGIGSFDIATGAPMNNSGIKKDYSNTFGDYLCNLAAKDENICAITAAMTLGTGLQNFAKKYPERFFDVGIAEEHAVTFAGGLAKGGLIPVFAVYSTFLQRAYDEIVHDVAMQKQKVVLAVDRAGFVGEDGRSHQGILDVAFLKSIPDTVIYSPSCYEELGMMLENAIYGPGNVAAVRYPRGKEGYIPDDYKPLNETASVYGNPKATTAIVIYGSLFSNAVLAKEELAKLGKDIKVIKLNRVWPIPSIALIEGMKTEKLFFFEEGAKSGGAGESFAYKLLKRGYKGSYVHVAVENSFVHHATIQELQEEFNLSPKRMVEKILGEV